jgi:hypothetical protein
MPLELGGFVGNLLNIPKQIVSDPGADGIPGVAADPWQASNATWQAPQGGGYNGYQPGQTVQTQRGSGSTNPMSQGNNGMGAIQAQPANPFGAAGGTDVNKLLYGQQGNVGGF